MRTKLGLIPCDWLIIVFLHLLCLWVFSLYFFFCHHSLSASGRLAKQAVLEDQIHVIPFDSECSSFNFTFSQKKKKILTF